MTLYLAQNVTFEHQTQQAKRSRVFHLKSLIVFIRLHKTYLISSPRPPHLESKFYPNVFSNISASSNLQ